MKLCGARVLSVDQVEGLKDLRYLIFSQPSGISRNIVGQTN